MVVMVIDGGDDDEHASCRCGHNIFATAARSVKPHSESTSVPTFVKEKASGKSSHAKNCIPWPSLAYKAAHVAFWLAVVVLEVRGQLRCVGSCQLIQSVWPSRMGRALTSCGRSCQAKPSKSQAKPKEAWKSHEITKA